MGYIVGGSGVTADAGSWRYRVAVASVGIGMASRRSTGRSLFLPAENHERVRSNHKCGDMKAREVIKHAKKRGEWAELCFLEQAVGRGLQVTKPWGETAHYDFAVEDEGVFSRVQVKSTIFKDRGGYSCSVRGASGPYEGDAFDYLAVYVIPEDVWYIIPAELVTGQGSVALYPELRGAKYGRYKEAWWLLRGRAGLHEIPTHAAQEAA